MLLPMGEKKGDDEEEICQETVQEILYVTVQGHEQGLSQQGWDTLIVYQDVKQAAHSRQQQPLWQQYYNNYLVLLTFHSLRRTSRVFRFVPAVPYNRAV